MKSKRLRFCTRPRQWMHGQQSFWRWLYATWRQGRNSLCPPRNQRRNSPQVKIHWRLLHSSGCGMWLKCCNLLSTVSIVGVQKGFPISVSTCGGNQELPLPARFPVSLSLEQPKTATKEPLSEWKMPAVVNRHVSPEVNTCTYTLKPLVRCLVRNSNKANWSTVQFFLLLQNSNRWNLFNAGYANLCVALSIFHSPFSFSQLDNNVV